MLHVRNSSFFNYILNPFTRREYFFYCEKQRRKPRDRLRVAWRAREGLRWLDPIADKLA